MHQISIEERRNGRIGKVGGQKERLKGGPTNCSLHANTWRQSNSRRLNYLPCLPVNEYNVPGVRNGIGRYFIAGQCCAVGFFCTWTSHVARRQHEPFSICSPVQAVEENDGLSPRKKKRSRGDVRFNMERKCRLCDVRYYGLCLVTGIRTKGYNRCISQGNHDRLRIFVTFVNGIIK